jgi:hypothetical protein
MRLSSFAFVTLSAGILVSCGGGEAPPGPPATVASLSSGTLSATAGAALSEPITVRVTDADGRNVPGVEVTFAVELGSGSLSAVGTTSANVTFSPQVVGVEAFTLVDSTDANGEAGAIWTLGTKAGAQSATATVTGLTPVSFNATASSGPAAESTLDPSAGLIGFVSDTLDGTLAVAVVDEHSNPVSDETVTWNVVMGGGAVAVATSQTDSSGVARATALLGASPGLNLFTGTVVGLPPDTIDAIGVVPVADPEGDAFSAGTGFAAHDVVRYGMGVVNSVGVIYFRYSGPVAPTRTSGSVSPNAIRAWVELDLDQDTTTGLPATRTCDSTLSPLGTFGFGSDAWIDLDPLSPILDNFTDPPDGSFAGARFTSVTFGTDKCDITSITGTAFLVTPVYGDRSVTGLFDFTSLDDDGTLDLTSLHLNGATGTLTDFVPDSLPHTFQLLPPSPPGVLNSAASQHLAERLMSKLPPGVFDVREQVVLHGPPGRAPRRR